MKLLVVHNRYQQAGGEDEVFRAETTLLRSAGHDVVEYTRSNDDIVLQGALARIRVAGSTIWAGDDAARLRAVLTDVRPDVAHFHNTLPLISPAAYYACADAGVAVVQTLHNYRLRCPSANHFRDGHVCEECTTSGLHRSVQHACYRGSRGATAAIAAMLAVHRAIGTWTRRVDRYIALSEFARAKFIEAGLPPEKLIVKPNFVDPDPGPRLGQGEGGVFVGRLLSEKGLDALLGAWEALPVPVSLNIVGDGPERAACDSRVASLPGVSLQGRLPRAQTLDAIRQAAFLVFPSECYEGMPLTIIEAFACGVPVIASRLGTAAEMVKDGRTGLLFDVGDASDLAKKVEWARCHPDDMAVMGRAARVEFEQKYTARGNLEQLLRIYDGAMHAASTQRRRPSPAVVTEPVATASSIHEARG